MDFKTLPKNIVPKAQIASLYNVRKSMSGNSCKNTKPELIPRKALVKAGYRGIEFIIK
jgi:hypothetical protein